MPGSGKSRQFQHSHVPSGLLNLAAMPGYTDKSRRYLRWAAANERRAASAHGQDFKVLLRRIAAQYRELAEQSDDPEAWRAKRRAVGTKPH